MFHNLIKHLYVLKSTELKTCQIFVKKTHTQTNVKKITNTIKILIVSHKNY